MMRVESSVSEGAAARQIALRQRHIHTAFNFGMLEELEMKSGKRAKKQRAKALNRRDRGERPRRSQRKAYFGGSGSILPRMRIVSRMVPPTISKLLGLSLSTVSCVVCQKTSL